MDNTFEEIRRQIHEIRNFLAPFDLKLAALDDRIADMRLSLIGVESKLLGTAFKVDEHTVTLQALLDRVKWIETVLKVPPRPRLTRESGWLPESENPDAAA